MSLRRGFKKEAEAYAQEFREELNLRPHEPLCPWRLAECLAISVCPLSTLREEVPGAVDHFTNHEQGSFSAITICAGYKRLIIYNDAHYIRRQASTLSHELAHGILGHIPKSIFDENGCRYFNKVEEEEADWLGATLLIPRPAALHIVEMGMVVSQAAEMYGASHQLIEWRLNITGARTQLSRRRRPRT